MTYRQEEIHIDSYAGNESVDGEPTLIISISPEYSTRDAIQLANHFGWSLKDSFPGYGFSGYGKVYLIFKRSTD